MSLGGLAIGIGMMVDGAVVMVENIHRHLTEKPDDSPRTCTRRQNRDRALRREGSRPAHRLRHFHHHRGLPAAVHLEGFEGKMFAPLAFTISFALLGSLILSLTLVPMLCTFFLKQVPHRARPVPHPLAQEQLISACSSRACGIPWLVVSPPLLALGRALRARAAASARSFCRRSTKARSPCRRSAFRASPCRNRSQLQTQAEKILKQFPEVIDVVSKTGRADIASDPMGVELSDVIVTLKPHEEWTTAKTKEELVEKMRDALAELPGVASSFSQPIALRVDELVSGVKSAIGIKIFGDDLDVLKEKGDAVARVLGKGARAPRT